MDPLCHQSNGIKIKTKINTMEYAYCINLFKYLMVFSKTVQFNDKT